MTLELDPNQALENISAIPLHQLMSKQVLTVYEGWSIKRLASFFVKHHVSGAPVIASDETLVGVVTQSDLVRFQSQPPSDFEMEKVVQFYYGPNSQGLTDADIRRLKERAIETCTVNAIMTATVIAIDLNTPASTACRRMVDEGLHRLFVTDQGRVVGVVTAMDFLRKMVVG
jgi:predicted transcriptional regulator